MFNLGFHGKTIQHAKLQLQWPRSQFAFVLHTRTVSAHIYRTCVNYHTYAHTQKPKHVMAGYASAYACVPTDS